MLVFVGLISVTMILFETSLRTFCIIISHNGQLLLCQSLCDLRFTATISPKILLVTRLTMCLLRAVSKCGRGGLDTIYLGRVLVLLHIKF